jgi:protein-S-isoprenylcysteine O-methyltransferase Ste14
VAARSILGFRAASIEAAHKELRYSVEEAMKPYFDVNHVAFVLLLIVNMGWGAMELATASNAREGATTIGGGGRRFTVLPAVIAAIVMIWVGPRIAPAAAIRPGAAAFTIGIVIMAGGLVLRGWSIKVLGDSYRLLRHPSYAGALLACAGYGLASANWVAFSAMVVLPLAAILWRIHTEEKALTATLGDRYRAYAAGHKRLVPLVW